MGSRTDDNFIVCHFVNANRDGVIADRRTKGRVVMATRGGLRPGPDEWWKARKAGLSPDKRVFFVRCEERIEPTIYDIRRPGYRAAQLGGIVSATDNELNSGTDYMRCGCNSLSGWELDDKLAFLTDQPAYFVVERRRRGGSRERSLVIVCVNCPGTKQVTEYLWYTGWRATHAPCPSDKIPEAAYNQIASSILPSDTALRWDNHPTDWLCTAYSLRGGCHGRLALAGAVRCEDGREAEVGENYFTTVFYPRNQGGGWDIPLDKGCRTIFVRAGAARRVFFVVRRQDHSLHLIQVRAGTAACIDSVPLSAVLDRETAVADGIPPAVWGAIREEFHTYFGDYAGANETEAALSAAPAPTVGVDMWTEGGFVRLPIRDHLGSRALCVVLNTGATAQNGLHCTEWVEGDEAGIATIKDGPEIWVLVQNFYIPDDAMTRHPSVQYLAVGLGNPAWQGGVIGFLWCDGPFNELTGDPVCPDPRLPKTVHEAFLKATEAARQAARS